jgi:heptosyltransferase-2
LLNDLRVRSWAERSEHLADEWLALAEDDGRLPRGEAKPRYALGPRGAEGLARLRELRPGFPAEGQYVALAPGALYGATKRWPAASFVALARHLRDQRGWSAVIVGGGSPAEVQLAGEVASACDGVSTAGATDLPTLAALLAGAAAFVGNDSGPMHLAAALGVATLGVFGSTSPAWTGPRGPRAATCGPFPVDCSPCFARSCPIGIPCLNDLTAQTVIDRLELLLGDPGREAVAR